MRPAKIEPIDEAYRLAAANFSNATSKTLQLVSMRSATAAVVEKLSNSMLSATATLALAQLHVKRTQTPSLALAAQWRK
jgi:hypothetical protein